MAQLQTLVSWDVVERMIRKVETGFRINHASAETAKRVFCPPSACPSPASSSRTGRNAGRWCRAARERFATPRAGIPHSLRSQDRIRNAPLDERDLLMVTETVTIVSDDVSCGLALLVAGRAHAAAKTALLTACGKAIERKNAFG